MFHSLGSNLPGFCNYPRTFETMNANQNLYKYWGLVLHSFASGVEDTAGGGGGGGGGGVGMPRLAKTNSDFSNISFRQDGASLLDAVNLRIPIGLKFLIPKWTNRISNEIDCDDKRCKDIVATSWRSSSLPISVSVSLSRKQKIQTTQISLLRRHRYFVVVQRRTMRRNTSNRSGRKKQSYSFGVFAFAVLVVSRTIVCRWRDRCRWHW